MPARPLSAFEQSVGRVIRAIPRGQTASYGSVAMYAGKPGGARAVARALHQLEGIPWWRVVRADGTLATPVAKRQAQKLAKEGVRVKGQRVVKGDVASKKRLSR